MSSYTSALLAAYMPARLQPFVSVSYPVWGSEHGHRVQLYRKGRNDINFVLFITIFFSLFRHFVMVYVLSPIAHRFVRVEAPPIHAGLDKATKERRLRTLARRKEHAAIRFAEQGWSMMYCLVTETIGLIIISRIPNATSPEQLWGTYPVTPIPWLTKVYYLVQLAWWFHQVYVLNTEKRRSDHWQMLFHHFITIALVTLSYVGNFTRVGVVVHTLMDLCDIFLPAAKLLRYVGFKVACDGMFVVFLLGWVCTRQVGLAMVTYSVTFKMPKFVAFQWNPAKERYMTAPVYATFVSLLVVLLILCTVWFCMAIRVALRVVRGQGAEDTRSDSEDGEEEEDEVEDDFEATNGTLNGNANGSANKSLANGNGLVKNTRSRTSSPKPIRNGTSTAHEQNGHANGSAETNGLGLKRRY